MPRLDGFGGGAIQLVSAEHIAVDGIVDVSGAAATGDSEDINSNNTYVFWNTGGGAGGGILLEAPTVTLAQPVYWRRKVVLAAAVPARRSVRQAEPAQPAAQPRQLRARTSRATPVRLAQEPAEVDLDA